MYRQEILTGVLLGLTAALLSEYLLIGIVVVILLFIVRQFDENLLFVLSIFLLLSFGSDIGEEVREMMNLLSISILIYLIAIRKYGVIKRLFLLPREIYYLFAFVLFSMLLSSAFSAQPAIGVLEAGRQVIFFVLILLLFLLIDSENESDTTLKVIVGSGTAVGIFILYSFFTSPADLEQLVLESYVKEGGLFKNIAAAGGLLMITTGTTIVALIAGRNERNKYKFLLWGILLLQLFAFMLTNSRAAFLGFVFALILMIAIFKRKLLYRVLITGGIALAALIMFVPEFSEAISNFLRLGRVLENTRYLLWDMMFSMIKDNPVLGVGPGMTKYNLDRYINVLWGTWDAEQLLYNFEKGGLGQAHNFYLFRWVELGIPGLLSALAVQVIFLYFGNYVRNNLKGIDNSEWKKYTGIVCIGAGLFLRAGFEATGILSHGWIGRDLPFWLLFIIVINKYAKIEAKNNLPIKEASEPV